MTTTQNLKLSPAQARYMANLDKGTPEVGPKSLPMVRILLALGVIVRDENGKSVRA